MNHAAPSPIAELYACPELAVLQAVGPDARAFLQSQLTQDMSQVSQTQAALAGFCTAQGRLWANLLTAQGQTDDEVIAVFAKDLQDSLLKRLKMFVLRSKVTLDTAKASVYGVCVPVEQLDAFVANLGYAIPSEVWASTASADQVRWIRLPSASDSVARYLVVATEGWNTEVLTLCAGQLIQAPAQAQWQAMDIEAGLPWIASKTQDMFIPQTVNLDLIAGVSFTKGCYPGQEVVARAHYRGTVKRRMHVGKVINSTIAIEPAMDIVHVGEPDSPVGRVINAACVASAHGSCTHVLFEAPFAAVELGGLAISTAEGPIALTEGKLPYPLLA